MIDSIAHRQVALVRDRSIYSIQPPYHPSEPYPEWPANTVARIDNPAYRCVRLLLYYLGLDGDNFGRPEWNPLSEVICPGDTVLLKPNLVHHENLGRRSYGLTDTDSLITHGSVIRVALDYAAKALRGNGRIIIGDCPIQDADWSKICELTGLRELADYCKLAFPNIDLFVKDYRLARAVIKNGVLVERVEYEGDLTSSYVEVDLGRDSMLIPLMQNNYAFGVPRYSRRRMERAHTPEQNLYLFPKDFLDANVVINLPKMKTHVKAGITCALKNLVGVNGHKDYLPHFRFGSPKNAGDEYPDGNWFWDAMWWLRHKEWELDSGFPKLVFYLFAWLCKQWLPFFSGTPKAIAESMGGGGWYGNDTLWRTILDINRAFMYYDQEMQRLSVDQPAKRRYFAILDGLVGGEHESPLAPSPVSLGLMMASSNPAALDAVAAAVMGFDIAKIPQVGEAFRSYRWPITAFGPEDITISGNMPAKSLGDIYAEGLFRTFAPSLGFKGRIEYHP